MAMEKPLLALSSVISRPADPFSGLSVIYRPAAAALVNL